ncbi:glycosyltransferase family 2 protein [Leuconostoc gelidum]|uniref:glycosyltransferase family 2 protein n=1 Tax=Leuconostoc gelidum TaxID=1244 RepID=UPI001CC6123D|nr:glycosyltransferase family 2 protein [Leuconostoc gelidum subsp. gelidum]
MDEINKNINEVYISAILPVYNVVDYLELAVKSLVTQTLENIEIILIDDGSTDGSGQLADDLVQRYKNVVTVHQQNSGAAAARNNGIKLAAGKYIYFMDPDDWIKPNMLRSMYSSAEQHQAQLVMTGFTNKYDNGQEQYATSVKPESAIYMNHDDFRKSAHIYLNNTMLAVPWNKLYSREHILERQLEFPSVKWDDLHFNLEAVKEIERVVVIDNDDYQFLRTRPGSETTKVFDKSLFEKRKQQFEHVLEIFDYWHLNNDLTDKALNYYFASRVFQVVQEISDNGSFTYKTKMQLIQKIANDELVETVLSGENDGSALVNMALIPLRHKKILLSLWCGKCVSFAKNRFSKSFSDMRVKLMKV